MRRQEKEMKSVADTSTVLVLPPPSPVGSLVEPAKLLPFRSDRQAVATPTNAEDIENDFFDRNLDERGEIIEGEIREGQLCAYAGPYGTAKTPSLQDITAHVINGRTWCGRKVSKRPVVAFDLESPGPVYKKNIRNISRRLNMPVPKVPEELEIYLEHDNPMEPATAKLLDVLESKDPAKKFGLIEEALKRKQNALVIIDPLELLFRIDTNKKVDVMSLYHQLRLLLACYPEAAILMTFNLRKKDKRATYTADLLTDPRGWLEEVCGSLDILNRSDVRLGVDIHEDDIRVINGIRRGEAMHPLLIRPVALKDSPTELAGFERCELDAEHLDLVLTPTQLKHWRNLPKSFRFDDVADITVPRASLYRLIEPAKSLGILEEERGVYHKKR